MDAPALHHAIRANFHECLPLGVSKKLAVNRAAMDDHRLGQGRLSINGFTGAFAAMIQRGSPLPLNSPQRVR